MVSPPDIWTLVCKDFHQRQFNSLRLLANPTPCQVPAHRFASLQKAGQQQQQQQFSTRTRLQRLHNHNTLAADPQHQQQHQQHFHAEQVQQQVQIPDLRRLPVSVKSSEYIMAKIQTHMAGAGHRPPAAPRTRHERQV